jgi:hypothetical protein
MNMNHVLKTLKREGTKDFGKSVSMSQSSDEEVCLAPISYLCACTYIYVCICLCVCVCVCMCVYVCMQLYV